MPPQGYGGKPKKNKKDSRRLWNGRAAAHYHWSARTRFSLPDSEIAAILADAVAT